MTPVISVYGISEFAGLDAAERQSGEADGLVLISCTDGQVVLGSRNRSSTFRDPGEHRCGLRATAAVEGQPARDPIISDEIEDLISVVFAKLAETCQFTAEFHVFGAGVGHRGSAAAGVRVNNSISWISSSAIDVAD